jgi:acyl dehydratase
MNTDPPLEMELALKFAQTMEIDSRAYYLEDLEPGQVFWTGSIEVTPEAIKNFAKEFDPQPFHMDEVAAERSVFGGLVASGWHTAALTMKLLVSGDFRPAHGFTGNSMDELCWPEPVRVGDVLRVRFEITEARPSRSNLHRGIVKALITTTNQAGHTVLSMKTNLVVPRRIVA